MRCTVREIHTRFRVPFNRLISVIIDISEVFIVSFHVHECSYDSVVKSPRYLVRAVNKFNEIMKNVVCHHSIDRYCFQGCAHLFESKNSDLRIDDISLPMYFFRT